MAGGDSLQPAVDSLVHKDALLLLCNPPAADLMCWMPLLPPALPGQVAAQHHRRVQPSSAAAMPEATCTTVADSRPSALLLLQQWVQHYISAALHATRSNPLTPVPQSKKSVLVPLQRWVRQRCRQGGIPPPSSVHLVSSLRGRGVRELLQDLHALAGPRQGLAAHLLGRPVLVSGGGGPQLKGTGGSQWEGTPTGGSLPAAATCSCQLLPAAQVS